MDKENVMYAYDEILFNLEKEGNSTISDNMDEPWGQYAQWNKPDMKGQIDESA